jgi:cytochrome c
MKKTLIMLAMVIAIASCGNNENKAPGEQATEGGASTDTQAGAGAQTADISTNPDYKKGLALIGQSDCLGCHKVSERLVGPSYQEVAERYAGQPGIEDSLASKIIHGGSGNWGQVPMTPHPNISKEDAVSMAKYILLLKEQK